MEEFTPIRPVDFHTMLLYTVANRNDIALPRPEVHVYLSHTLSEYSSPNVSFIVGNHVDLQTLIDTEKSKPEPHALPYLVSKASGDFFINYTSIHPKDEKLFQFTGTCYELANHFAGLMGKHTEKGIYRSLAKELEDYVKLLAACHNLLMNSQEIEITDQEFRAFKAYCEGTFKKKPLSAMQFKQKTGKEFLM